jgi:hypothetical protein
MQVFFAHDSRGAATPGDEKSKRITARPVRFGHASASPELKTTTHKLALTNLWVIVQQKMPNTASVGQKRRKLAENPS